MTHSAAIASSALHLLPAAGVAWLEETYGLVPHLTCTECFIPALGGANAASAYVEV